MAKTSNCPECGADIEEGANFCSECGADLSRTKPTTPRAAPAVSKSALESMFSRTVATVGSVFGILLAWIGAIIGVFGSGSTALNAAATLNYLGFATTGIFVLGAGISNSDIDRFARLGMILGGLLMLAFTLAIGALASMSGILPGLSGF